MEVTNNPELYQEIMSHLRETHMQPREGLHLTDLTKCLTMTYWQDKQPVVFDDASVLRMVAGIGFEMAIHKGHGTDADEVEQGGIVFSPDYYNDKTRLYAEIKTGRMGMNPDGSPKKGWPELWIKQIKGYCIANGLTQIGLVVYYILPSVLVCKTFVFSEQELMGFREWLDFRINVLVQAKLESKPPQPFAFNESWECNNCEYKEFLCNVYTESKIYIPQEKGDSV